MRLPFDIALFGIHRITALGELPAVPATNRLSSPEPSLDPTGSSASPAPVSGVEVQIAPPAPASSRADLRGGDLKLVRSRILFVRRGLEVSFPSREDLISDDLDTHVFEAWKIAEFVQSLADPRKAPEMPDAWAGYLSAADRHSNGKIRRIPAGDHKYLRVFFEILGYHPREGLRYREDHLRLLREISLRLEDGEMRWR